MTHINIYYIYIYMPKKVKRTYRKKKSKTRPKTRPKKRPNKKKRKTSKRKRLLKGQAGMRSCFRRPERQEGPGRPERPEGPERTERGTETQEKIIRLMEEGMRRKEFTGVMECWNESTKEEIRNYIIHHRYGDYSEEVFLIQICNDLKTLPLAQELYPVSDDEEIDSLLEPEPEPEPESEIDPLLEELKKMDYGVYEAIIAAQKKHKLHPKSEKERLEEQRQLIERVEEILKDKV
jgi:hypothetical protein